MGHVQFESAYEEVLRSICRLAQRSSAGRNGTERSRQIGKPGTPPLSHPCRCPLPLPKFDARHRRRWLEARWGPAVMPAGPEPRVFSWKREIS